MILKYIFIAERFLYVYVYHLNVQFKSTSIFHIYIGFAISHKSKRKHTVR
jgi:hypothetical protein